MNSKKIDIPRFIKETPKKCKLALLFNFFLFIGMLFLTYILINLGIGDLKNSHKAVMIILIVSMLVLDIITFLAIQGFANSNKIASIFFMIISVFAIPFATAYGLKGMAIIVFLLATVITNVMCYNFLHPKDRIK